jgi:hypothetical protein
MQEETLVCEQCDQSIRDTDAFCPHCGGLFVGGVKCKIHPSHNASGVCILCSLPWCSNCGETANGRFLCKKHSAYEIIEDMVRICGVNNSAMAEYFRACLEEGGFHPFIYSGNTYHRASMEGTPLAVGGNTRAPLSGRGEFKIMVPIPEVEQAEAFLEELDTTHSRIK